jgi:uncharacterized DUF497 family protein
MWQDSSRLLCEPRATLRRWLLPCATLIEVTFEWDARKAAANLKKHKVTLEDAATVFLDPFATTFPDPDHSRNEQREITIGHTMEGHLSLRCSLRARREDSDH